MRSHSVNRRDLAEAAIVDALEKVGCLVDQVDGRPYDLVVQRAGKLFLMECKSSPAAARAKTAPNKRQADFRKLGWVVHVVLTPIDALRVVGLVSWRDVARRRGDAAERETDAQVAELRRSLGDTAP